MRNIIITGGGFGNKGAEAMTYVTVSEIRERFPKHKIYLFLPEKDRLEKDFKSNFNNLYSDYINCCIAGNKRRAEAFVFFSVYNCCFSMCGLYYRSFLFTVYNRSKNFYTVVFI